MDKIKTGWAETRLLIAELLLGLAIRIAPAGHPDSHEMLKALEGYLKYILAQRTPTAKEPCKSEI